MKPNLDQDCDMGMRFMEFEVEEEQQIQKMKLLASCSQFQAPLPKSTKPTPSPATESGQQQVYIPKKAAAKSRQPRRRQRRSPSAPAPGAPREIPAEAVHQYAEIMEALDTSWEEEEDEKKAQRGRGDPRDQEDGMFPDPSLLQYIDQLCGDEEFVCKVEAVIHPQFMTDLLSAEKSHDPMDLVEELEEELNLTANQLSLLLIPLLRHFSQRNTSTRCSHPTNRQEGFLLSVKSALAVLSPQSRLAECHPIRAGRSSSRRKMGIGEAGPMPPAVLGLQRIPRRTASDIENSVLAKTEMRTNRTPNVLSGCCLPLLQASWAGLNLLPGVKSTRRLNDGRHSGYLKGLARLSAAGGRARF
uniref:Uncharacterized protein n=1 Tax=Sphaerodactylus townsendi TaxID=933632 RepID=A0ACB8EVC8_9SAUR